MNLQPLQAEDIRKLLADTVERLELENPALVKAMPSKYKHASKASSTPKKHSTLPDDTPNNNARLVRKLAYISPDCAREDWVKIVWAILSTGFARAKEIAYQWSIQSELYTDTDFNNLIRDYRVTGNGGVCVSMGTIYHHARAGGYTS